MVDVALVDDITTAIDFDVATIAKFICPDFTAPCPRIVTTNFTFTLFGASFKMGWVTDLPTIDRYRQRELISGVPGAWSPSLPFSGQHSTYETVHIESQHQVSNKNANTVWDYQIRHQLQDPTWLEFYPNCGLSVIRVQYPPKLDPGGGVVIPDTPV